MVRTEFPWIEHRFDPWHYIRNVTLTLMKVRSDALNLFSLSLYRSNQEKSETFQIAKANYMALLRPWIRTIINKLYAAIIEGKGNGDLTSQMWRSALYCMAGIHDFTHVSSLTVHPKTARIFTMLRCRTCTSSPAALILPSNLELDQSSSTTMVQSTNGSSQFHLL